jgi:hypothetical protein
MGLAASSQSAVDAFVELCDSPAGSITELDDLLTANLHVLNAPSSSGKLALVTALDAGNEDTAHWLLTDPYDNLRINNCGEDGRTALMSCCAAPAPFGVRLRAQDAPVLQSCSLYHMRIWLSCVIYHNIN